MVLITLYFAVALVLVPLIFVAAAWLSHDHVRDRRHRWFYSLFAGLVWPLLVVALAQFMAIVAARQVVRGHQGGPAEPALLGVNLPDATGSFRVQPWTPAH